MEHLTHFFLSFVDRYGYAGVFVVMVLGNMAIPVGAEFVMVTVGALAATGHLSNLWIAVLIATLGEVVGGSILYAIGYAGGKPFVERYGRYLKLSPAKFATWHEFYERHGNVIIFVCRFLPVIRGIAALPAGVSRMPKRYFVTYTAIGSLIFCAGLAMLGATMGRHSAELGALIHRSTTAILVVVLLAIVALAVRATMGARRRAA